MVLSRSLEEKLERTRERLRAEGRVEGRVEERAEWRAWVARMREAQAKGEPAPSERDVQTHK